MSNSFQPHGLYPDRLLCPWDSPGVGPGVGCHEQHRATKKRAADWIQSPQEGKQSVISEKPNDIPFWKTFAQLAISEIQRSLLP